MTQSHCNFRSVLECASRSQFHQPPLPYAVEQLEPYLSAEALRTHYEEHDAFYLACGAACKIDPLSGVIGV